MRSQGFDPADSPEILFWTGLFTVFLLWWIPKLQAARSAGASADNLFERENESRKTLAQIIGGVLLLAGLYSSVKTFNLQRDIENLQKEGQITDRYTKAIDQLGALAPGGGVDAEGRPKINLEVRLGGIYALERIAKDSPKDHWTIMEVLTAYVRQNAPVKKHDEASPGHLTHLMRYGSRYRKEGPSLRADIQAILTVIGRRDVNRDPNERYLDLHNVDLVGAHLMNANFTNASFHRSDLSGTVFNHVDFIQAEFSGALLREAQLSECNLTGSEFAGATLTETYLVGSYFAGANFAGANLTGAYLDGSIFTGASFVDADLSEARDFRQEQLTKAYGNSATKLPKGLLPPKSWVK